MSHPPRKVGPMDETIASALPLPLPFDDELDAPVGFSLTPRARRAVSPEQLPSLRLVPGDGGRAQDGGALTEDPTDVRPAQARALRRSGMPAPTIAAAIGADLDLVARWTEDTEPVRRPTRRSSPPRPLAVPAAAPSRRDARPVAHAARPRAVAAQEARGMAVALAALDADLSGVGFTHAHPEILGAILVEIRRQVPLPDWRVRVAIRVAAELGVDRCRSAVAAALGIDEERIVAGRWQDAPSRDALEVTLRIADERAARTVLAWTDGIAGPAAADRATA
jgi:hypothetical protein